MSWSRTASSGRAPARSIPTIVPGKKTTPVVFVESIRVIMPERRLRVTAPRAASPAVAPSASVASIWFLLPDTSSASRLSATAAAVIALPMTIPPTGTR